MLNNQSQKDSQIEHYEHYELTPYFSEQVTVMVFQCENVMFLRFI